MHNEGMSTWALEDINVGELFERAEKEGPQMVTRQGVETAVVVPVAEWKRIKESKYPTVKDWLLAPEPRFDFDPYITRQGPRLREVPELD